MLVRFVVELKKVGQIEEVGQFIDTSIWLLAIMSILYKQDKHSFSSKILYGGKIYLMRLKQMPAPKHIWFAGYRIEEVRHNFKEKTTFTFSVQSKTNDFFLLFLSVYGTQAIQSMKLTKEEI